MKRLALLALLVALCVTPSQAAITATELLVKGIQQTYSSYAVAGTLNGTTPVEVTMSPTWSTNGGSVIVLITGGTDAQTVTASLRDSRFASAEADLMSMAATVGTPTTLRAGIVGELVEEITKDSRMTLPPSSYVLRIVSSGATTATVSATVFFSHTP
jgi:hypothetical protein